MCVLLQFWFYLEHINDWLIDVTQLMRIWSACRNISCDELTWVPDVWRDDSLPAFREAPKQPSSNSRANRKLVKVCQNCSSCTAFCYKTQLWGHKRTHTHKNTSQNSRSSSSFYVQCRIVFTNKFLHRGGGTASVSDKRRHSVFDAPNFGQNAQKRKTVRQVTQRIFQ